MINCDVVDPATLVNTSKHTANDSYRVTLTDVDAFTYIATDDSSDESESRPSLVRSRSSPSLAPSSPSAKQSKQLVHIRAPSKLTQWRRGQSVVIQWDRVNVSVSEVRIVLLRKGAPAGSYTIVADHVENNGLFVFMRVPFGLVPDSDYYLRIMSMDGKQYTDSECFSVCSS
ncbi:hypothetical protein LEN26_005151 [Aphanomyces euteiches]|nr:hypothetical protein AeMF1_015333 [Aphanomyces euteiches]KAH9111332.1 hypothetical protein AeMF1_014110 [Aphanomyces euteiches]KAH9119810.1 hypothetical protein AeMF1_007716 [Aphanomyces euteiches]KAH9123725.1 hypothetical protein AeMF1_005368 [Aphanomyces euteiches]KAH9128674.1 hypothetical protein LEN26_009080 [Aphanomyces euteiches]